MSLRRLVITADDFGAAKSVNEAVEIAHREGVLSAASLMVTGRAFEDAIERARRNPRLAVGLHLVLVDGRPRLPRERASRLIDGHGDFRGDMAGAGMRMFFQPETRRQLTAEIEAQFAAFAETGLPLDHVNAHKHFHLHPTIGGLILRIGSRYGITALRAPLEPAGPLRAADPGARVSPSPLIGALAGQMRAEARRAGLTVPDQVFGLRWSGAMDTIRLGGLIRALPEGLSEIYLHPATEEAFSGSAPGYRHREELAALISGDVREAVAAVGARLGGFRDFAATRRTRQGTDG